MSDDRPTSSPNGNGRPQIKAVRCLTCGQVVPLDQTFPMVEADEGRAHVGPDAKVCGPAGELLFHVVLLGVVNGQLAAVRRLLPTLQTPEENYEVVNAWEAAVSDTYRKVDGSGAVILGRGPKLVVTDWKPVGVRL